MNINVYLKKSLSQRICLRIIAQNYTNYVSKQGKLNNLDESKKMIRKSDILDDENNVYNDQPKMSPLNCSRFLYPKKVYYNLNLKRKQSFTNYVIVQQALDEMNLTEPVFF